MDSRSASEEPEELARRPTELSVKITRTKRGAKANAGSKSAITVMQFLDFLKTAYQVQENIEDILLAEGMKDTVDWIKLKEQELIRSDFWCQTSQVNLADNGKTRSDTAILKDADVEDGIKRKLSEVLSEGILDSVLPYFLPQTDQNSRRPSQHKLTEKGSHYSLASSSTYHSAKSTHKKSSENIHGRPPIKTDSEVLIHVCDEVKNTKKDFVCNQKLLIEKMGYFAQITAGQKLEDMDISVHCDINIFEWLMNWLKSESGIVPIPILDMQNIIPITVSAAFLQMEPLLHECLLFVHENMNEILRSATNLNCINDAVLTRLAAMYTNSEIEMIRDRKDRIQSRLYCKMIQSICEPEPESVRGHWSSLAYLYQCEKCQQLTSPSVAQSMPCITSCIQLQPNGELISKHVRSLNWNINDYIRKLHKNLRTWRRVYWRLWGSCHFLSCIICKKPFPAHQIGWCRYHPDPPQFFTVDAHKAPLPIGRYPCCGERAYRFELFDNQAGCKFREHCPSTETIRDSGIVEILDKYRHLIEEEPPELIFPERLTRLVARDNSNSSGKLQSEGMKFWWDGLVIIPPRSRLGLLGAFSDLSPEDVAKNIPDDSYFSDSSMQTSNSSSFNDLSDEGEENYILPITQKPKRSPRRKRRRKKKKKPGKLWLSKLSARSNQDLQRTYEEHAFKKMAVVLHHRSYISENGKRLLTGKTWPRHVIPPGGVWVRLEAEWLEENNLSAKQNSFYSRNKPRAKNEKA